MPEIFPFVSPLLTLGDINSSQEEMSYITRMRNVIKFQIEKIDDYEHLRVASFKHKIICLISISFTLETCLSYTLVNVVKSHVLVHNIIPFRNWRIIIIDDDGFREGQNPFRHLEQRVWRAGNMSTDLFLATFFANFLRIYFSYTWCSPLKFPSTIFTANTLDSIEIAEPAINVNSKHHTWRRIYADNYSLFSCSGQDIAAYIKEKTNSNKSVNVFKKIMKRELGDSISEYKVLESIASPYYYELPHQNEEEYAIFRAENDWCLGRNGLLYVVYSFECGLENAMKHLA
ncbi:uncharacterized protein NPIL_94471 [Nephila pilipes]|uniref:Uncharacterized protein n=1 Tax=Nephila pilipes TaxID=299642 RepID=A0A8X6TGP0_NEPPI|nr:uncharacterized protein NPIL_320461 [Nephila pilipes]GFT14843.1 uncharacterized protein NPIL_94471 [Nephila pilipes]